MAAKVVVVKVQLLVPIRIASYLPQTKTKGTKNMGRANRASTGKQCW